MNIPFDFRLYDISIYFINYNWHGCSVAAWAENYGLLIWLELDK